MIASGRMWVMNRVAAAGAALVVLSLTGCSLLFHQDDVAEDPLRERIGDLVSVVDIRSTVDGFTDRSYFSVSVNELVESDLHTIVASADELLAGRDVTFKVALDEQVLLTIVFPNDFSAEELASEVDYWIALSGANKAPLGILLQHSRTGRYRNIWDPDKTDLVDWEALRAVPDSSTADLSYHLDDIVSLTSMPTPDVIALRDRLVAIEVADDETVSLEYFAPGYIMVRYFSPEAGRSDPTAVANWPRVQEVVSEIAAMGLPQSNFVFSTDFSDGYASGASVHLGDCAQIEGENPGWASAELATALTSSGIEFPLGMSSGFCDDAHE
jgi:hypothetical protein